MRRSFDSLVRWILYVLCQFLSVSNVCPLVRSLMRCVFVECSVSYRIAGLILWYVCLVIFCSGSGSLVSVFVIRDFCHRWCFW